MKPERRGQESKGKNQTEKSARYVPAGFHEFPVSHFEFRTYVRGDESIFLNPIAAESRRWDSRRSKTFSAATRSTCPRSTPEKDGVTKS